MAGTGTTDANDHLARPGDGIVHVDQDGIRFPLHEPQRSQWPGLHLPVARAAPRRAQTGRTASSLRDRISPARGGPVGPNVPETEEQSGQFLSRGSRTSRRYLEDLADSLHRLPSPATPAPGQAHASELIGVRRHQDAPVLVVADVRPGHLGEHREPVPGDVCHVVGAAVLGAAGQDGPQRVSTGSGTSR